MRTFKVICLLFVLLTNTMLWKLLLHCLYIYLHPQAKFQQSKFASNCRFGVEYTFFGWRISVAVLFTVNAAATKSLSDNAEKKIFA